MKLVIFGASGGTGGEVMKQALEDHHEVTAIVRKPETISMTDPHLTVVAGDALKPESFADTLRGHDAVVSTLGVSSFIESLQPMTFHHDTAVNIVNAMKAQNVQRLICITSVGVHNNPKAPLYYRAIVHPLLSQKYEDMQHMETVVRDSGLDWTIVRPSSLNHEGRTGQYTLAVDSDLEKTGAISRADVADFILKALSDPATIGHAVAISY